ncbi:MAG: hypothetical protein ABI637_08480 [Gemmatimonadota bacterium]
MFAIADEASFSPRYLHAIAVAFSGGSPVAIVLRGLARAVKSGLHGASRRD